jgi:hypothetical protein
MQTKTLSMTKVYSITLLKNTTAPRHLGFYKIIQNEKPGMGLALIKYP